MQKTFQWFTQVCSTNQCQ